MAEAFDTFGIIYQNLIDAGCDEHTRDKCMSYARAGNYAQMLSLLSKYKTVLLGRVRCGQKQIDCLDYLIYQIEKSHFRR